MTSASDENACDACGGTGVPTSGGLCMCAGTGKLSEAARLFLRPMLMNTRAALTRLADAVDAVRHAETSGDFGYTPHQWDELLVALASARLTLGVGPDSTIPLRPRRTEKHDA